MNTTFHQIGPLTRDGFNTCCTECRETCFSECETGLAELRVTAVCYECRAQARMERDHNWLVGVLILIAALGVVFEIGYNVGLRGSGL